jgi:hypothetical protein
MRKAIVTMATFATLLWAGPACATVGSLGSPCTDPRVCFSLYCVDGVCCQGPCPADQYCNIPGSEGFCTFSAPLTITTTSLPNATSGQSYGATLAATGGSGTGYRWSWSGSLPPGFMLSLDGVLSSTGSPATPADSYSFTVQVTDSAADGATQPLTLVIQCPAVKASDIHPFPGLPLSQDGGFTTMNATFRPTDSNGSAVGLLVAARACGFAGFNWQQQVASLPCGIMGPSVLSPKGQSQLIQDNMCTGPFGGSITAPPAFYDTPVARNTGPATDP